MSNGMLGSSLADAVGPLKDLLDKLVSRRGEWWLAALKKFLRGENPFEVDMSTEAQLARWRELLYEDFGYRLDAVKIPERKPGFDRLIVVPKRLNLNQIVRKMRKRFDVWLCCEGNLNKSVTENDRTNDETYAIWVRDRMEADEEHKHKSANELEEEGIKGITLMERLLLELIYHSETDKHLDLEYGTLCSGSRHSDNKVPSVMWDPDDLGLYVEAFDPYYSVHAIDLRAREVVS